MAHGAPCARAVRRGRVQAIAQRWVRGSGRFYRLTALAEYGRSWHDLHVSEGEEPECWCCARAQCVLCMGGCGVEGCYWRVKN